MSLVGEWEYSFAQGRKEEIEVVDLVLLLIRLDCALIFSSFLLETEEV
jgi:hypothetical protein